jgi:hypothetical protein
MKVYSADLLKELECPVCYEHMLPPIVICVNAVCVLQLQRITSELSSVQIPIFESKIFTCREHCEIKFR